MSVSRLFSQLSAPEGASVLPQKRTSTAVTSEDMINLEQIAFTSESDRELPSAHVNMEGASQSSTFAGSQPQSGGKPSSLHLTDNQTISDEEEELTTTPSKSHSTQPSKKVKSTSLWPLCFDQLDDGSCKCPFLPESHLRSGNPHPTTLTPNGDMRVLEKHMKRWHSKVWDAITAAVEKKKDIQIVITQLRKDHSHSSSLPGTMPRFFASLDKKPGLPAGVCLSLSASAAPVEHPSSLCKFRALILILGIS